MPAPFPSVSDEFLPRDATATDGSPSLFIELNESVAVFAPVLSDFVLEVHGTPGPSPVSATLSGAATIRCDFASPFVLGNTYRIHYQRSTSEIRSEDGSVLADFDILVAVIP